MDNSVHFCSICQSVIKSIIAKINCNHEFCDTCLKIYISTQGRACPLCRENINKIDRDISSIDKDSLMWLFQASYSDDGKIRWWYYDPDTSKTMEIFYKDYKENGVPAIFKLSIGSFQCIIDLDEQIQICVHNRSFRKISRIDMIDKDKEVILGIAGIKF
jgi:hypothetical protein